MKENERLKKHFLRFTWELEPIFKSIPRNSIRFFSQYDSLPAGAGMVIDSMNCMYNLGAQTCTSKVELSSDNGCNPPADTPAD